MNSNPWSWMFPYRTTDATIALAIWRGLVEKGADAHWYPTGDGVCIVSETGWDLPSACADMERAMDLLMHEIQTYLEMRDMV